MNATGTGADLSGESGGTARCALANLLKHEYVLLFAGYILTCFACYLYVVLAGNGLRVVYGDSWVYTDLAKRMAFNHSLLHRDYVNPVIYPPLYPLLISVAYFFREPAATFAAIKIVNILVYSSAFIPIYCLLKYYAGLSRSRSFAGAILLQINWCSLCYVIHIASEPLYCPLLAWFAWFLFDNKHLKGKLDLFLFISIISAIPLTRTAGSLVFPCLAGVTIVRLIHMRKNQPAPGAGKLIWRTIIVLMASALIILMYNMYLKSVLPKSPGDAFGGYLSIVSEPQAARILLMPSYWFDRAAYSFSWILICTGTVAVPLLLSIVIRNVKILYEDSLALFLLLFLAGTLAIVPLFTATDYLGGAHERYYDPIMFLFIVILFKYIDRFAPRDLAIAGVMTLLFSVSAPPFPLFLIAGAIPAVFGNAWAVYAGIYAVACAVFMCMLLILYRYRKCFVNIFLIMMAISTLGFYFMDYMGGNKLGPNTFGFYDDRGLTKEVLAERASNPKAELIVDLSWRDSRGGCKHWEYWKILINLPVVPVFKELTGYLADPQNKGKRFMVLTHQYVPNAAKVVKGREIALYIFDH